MHTAFAAAALITFIQAEEAKPLIHPVFGDGAVIPRQIAAPVWGWTTPAQTVTVTFSGKDVTATADSSGLWEVKIGPFPANPVGQTMTIKTGSETKTISNLVIGDVWLASGQSNMEWPVSAASTHEAVLKSTRSPQVRCFNVVKHVSLTPMDTLRGKWFTADTDNVTFFTAVGYHFASMIEEKTKVPIGLLHSSWGGTRIESWISSPTLKTNPLYTSMADPVQPTQEDYKNPTKLSNTIVYNAMIAPLAKYPIRGALWYQGESNTEKAAEYESLLGNLITDWRGHFGSATFPFYIVQLPGFYDSYPEPQPTSNWATMRQSQKNASVKNPRTQIAVTLDLAEGRDIHPRNKKDVGERLARIALKDVYQQKIVAHGPRVASHKITPELVTVTFTSEDGKLIDRDGGAVRGFALFNKEGKRAWVDGTIKGLTVEIPTTTVPEPTHVRYGFVDNPVADLTNGEGLPAEPFASDAQ
jgi:sialate O-acetylesterase